MPYIRVSSLSKSFSVRAKDQGSFGFMRSFLFPRMNTKKAVESVSFEIEKGELVGFIGPNGAGKTTTLKMLSGLLYPTSGTIDVLGYQPFQRDHSFLRQITLVMGQKQQLWWELPVVDSFRLNKEIYQISDAQYKKTIDELVDLFELSDVIYQPPRNLSLGQRMKCELLAALLHNPKVLFLDEPTIGLDVVMQQHLRDFIVQYNKRYNATIILTSHYMDDVKQLCERVIIINEGSIVFDGKLADLCRTHADYKVLSLVFTQPVPKAQIESFGEIESYDDISVEVKVAGKDVQHVASKILKEFPVEDITIQEPSIEDVIRTIFEKKK